METFSIYSRVLNLKKDAIASPTYFPWKFDCSYASSLKMQTKQVFFPDKILKAIEGLENRREKKLIYLLAVLAKLNYHCSILGS